MGIIAYTDISCIQRYTVLEIILWFKVPVKVEQINEYLFSDTVQSQWKQKVAVMK